MRESLTILACALIALLTAALAGPWLIDWTAHRDFVEARLSSALGAKVTTRGDIDLKLLPTPYLTLDGFDLETPRASVRAGRSRFEMAVTPLLRGELRFYDASIHTPDITVRLVGDQPAAMEKTDASFEHVSIVNASLRVLGVSGNPSASIASVDVEGEAASLFGPFKGSGVLHRDAGGVGFRFATGGLEASRMRLKLVSDESAWLPHADLDGVMIFENAGHPAFEGQAILTGASPAPWKVSGPARIDERGARIEKLETRLGADDSAISLQGSASVEVGAAALARLALNAGQIDLDRFVASPFFASLRAALSDGDTASDMTMPLEVSVATPAALLGGDSLSDVSARVRVARGSLAIVEASAASGPGGSRVSLKGDVETGAAAAFRGKLSAGARDLPRFADWLGRVAPWDVARLHSLPLRALDVSGDVVVFNAGFDAKNLTIKADRSTMTGSAAYSPALSGERARLFADLSSEAFDLDTAPDLSGAASVLGDADLAVTIDARAIRVARFGEGTIDAGRIRARLKREGERVDLENLSIADLGGATLRANGQADARGGRLEGAISAERLGDLTAFLKRVAPGLATDAFAARATALSPTTLGFHIDAKRSAPTAPLALASLTVVGNARGTSINANAKSDGAGGALSGALKVASSDAAMFARQIGLDVGNAAVPGGASLELSARGDSGPGVHVDGAGKIAGADVTFRGRVMGPTEANGDMGLDTADLSTALRLFGLGLPDTSLKPSAHLVARGKVGVGQITIAGIAGSLGGSAIAGDLSIDTSGKPRIAGSLRMDGASLPLLAQSVLGPTRAAKPGEFWSSTPFATGIPTTPSATIDMNVANLRFSDTLSGSNAHFKLVAGPGVTTFDEINANLGDGRMSGHLTLRRDGPNASLIGEIALEGVAFDRTGASGTLSGAADFSATGTSMAALVSGLAAQGRARIEGLTIARADPAAPARVLRRADNGDLFISENDFLGALRRELDAAPLKIGDKTFAATMSGGVMKLASPDGVTLSYDARTAMAETRATLTAQPLPKDWDGAPPRLTVVWKSALAAPIRDVEAGAFVATLTARALAREQARIEAFEADVRERAFFNRRLKGLAFMRQREREIAAFDAEQARLAAEAERRRAIEAAEAERKRALEAVEAERRRAAEAIEADRKLVLEAARLERERRAAEIRRRAEEAAEQRASAPSSLPPSLFQPPAPESDPSAAGRY